MTYAHAEQMSVWEKLQWQLKIWTQSLLPPMKLYVSYIFRIQFSIQLGGLEELLPISSVIANLNYTVQKCITRKCQ